MQAVILAAGRSTRTLPLTSTRPKPLIPVWGRPLLEHQLDQLHGLVDEALVVVGYLREQIEAHFGEDYRGISLRYVLQERQRGTADALLAARPFVSARTLVLNGDDFYHHDDLEMLASSRGLLVARAPDPQNRAVVTLDGDRVVGIVEKPQAPPRDALSSLGGYCLESDDLRLLDGLSESPRGELELPDLILRLVERESVRAREIRKLWIPLTYAWDVLTFMSVLWDEPERARELGLPSRPGNVDVRCDGPLWVGEDVRVHESARLVGPLALGPGTRIEANAVVERSTTFDEVVVGAGARVSDSVLGAKVTIGAGARLLSRPGHQLRVDVKGKSVVPDLARLGAVVGDGVHVPERSVVPAGELIPSAVSA